MFLYMYVNGHKWRQILKCGAYYCEHITQRGETLSVFSGCVLYKLTYMQVIRTRSQTPWITAVSRTFRCSSKSAVTDYSLWLYFQDAHLDKFFTLVYVLEEYSFPFRLKDVIITEANMEGELKASMAALKGALLDTCVRFLHQLLNKLIQLIVYPPVIAGQIGELPYISSGFGAIKCCKII